MWVSPHGQVTWLTENRQSGKEIAESNKKKKIPKALMNWGQVTKGSNATCIIMNDIDNFNSM